MGVPRGCFWVSIDELAGSEFLGSKMSLESWEG